MSGTTEERHEIKIEDGTEKAHADADTEFINNTEAEAGNADQTDTGADKNEQSDTSENDISSVNGDEPSEISELDTSKENEANADEPTDDVKAEESETPKERKLGWAKKLGGSKKESAEDKLKTLVDEANDKYARLFAEFDNFRKRTDREKSERYDMGARDMIEKILPVLDNFERGFSTVEESDREDAFVTGMDLVYKQFVKVLEDAGVEAIEAVGKEFNPDLHNAVMHVDDPEAGENIIVEEFQKGYTYKGHVVRYSMVKVAN